MGNSEVGHLNIGAGRIIYQPLQLINEKIKDKSIYNNDNINEVINHVKNNNSKLHLFGLLSDGGVHSHINHLLALIDVCKEKDVKEVYFHYF
jgi:2,3-bisphosphoglycerate-independent phosphoglycerate mutase